MSLWNIKSTKEYIIRIKEFNNNLANLTLPMNEEGNLRLDDIKADFNVLLSFVKERKIKAFLHYDLRVRNKYDQLFYSDDSDYKYRIFDVTDDYVRVFVIEGTIKNVENWKREEVIESFKSGKLYYMNINLN
jgi:hypothetical protein